MLVRIIRPHGETFDYDQECVEDRGDLIVTRFTFTDFTKPLIVGGGVVVDEGYRALMFEFFDPPLEIIKVYDHENAFTGYFCNVNTRPHRIEGGYEIVDLYLDIFVLPDLTYEILDEDEFEEAVREGWISEEQAAFAKSTLAKVIDDVEAGNFPPVVVREFPA